VPCLHRKADCCDATPSERVQSPVKSGVYASHRQLSSTALFRLEFTMLTRITLACSRIRCILERALHNAQIASRPANLHDTKLTIVTTTTHNTYGTVQSANFAESQLACAAPTHIAFCCGHSFTLSTVFSDAAAAQSPGG
jgi:hypothetical protein